MHFTSIPFKSLNIHLFLINSKMPPIQNLLRIGLGTEVIYAFVIIVCSLIIYFGTKEIYELTKHEGIKYFRRAFLFFAIAFLFGTFIKFLLVYFGINSTINLPPRLVGFLSLFVFVYAGTMASLYLVQSLWWKKFKWVSARPYLLHVLAIVLAIIGVFYRNLEFLILINVLLLIFVIFFAFSGEKNSKNKHGKMGWIYVLLFIFWILNIYDILIPNNLGSGQILLYLSSLGIFLTILYKALKRIGAN